MHAFKGTWKKQQSRQIAGRVQKTEAQLKCVEEPELENDVSGTESSRPGDFGEPGKFVSDMYCIQSRLN